MKVDHCQVVVDVRSVELSILVAVEGVVAINF
jgi:hypothetical protein